MPPVEQRAAADRSRKLSRQQIGWNITAAVFMEGFLQPSFRTALTARGDTDAATILDGIFADTAARIAADPRSVSPTYRLVVGRVTRTDEALARRICRVVRIWMSTPGVRL